MVPLQIVPNDLIPFTEINTHIDNWLRTSQTPNILKVIPEFFTKIKSLNFKMDLPFIRSIVYSNGKDFIKIEKGFKRNLELLGVEFMINVYKQLGRISNAKDFYLAIISIEAEINCAKNLLNINATNIKKCETPEDIKCVIDNKDYGFQVKYKTNDEYIKSVIEEAICGEVFNPDSVLLREYNLIHIDIHKMKEVKKRFLNNLIKYIHSDLNSNLCFEFQADYIFEDLIIEQYFYNNHFAIDIKGSNDYENSFITIILNQNGLPFIGSATSADDMTLTDTFFKLLTKNIQKIQSQGNLIGWIDVNVRVNYVGDVSNKDNVEKIINFLNQYNKPLILIIRFDFLFSSDEPIILFSNNKFREFSFSSRVNVGTLFNL